MNPDIIEAISLLQEVPDEQGDHRNSVLVQAMISALRAHENPFGMLISLVISCMYQQEHPDNMLIQFLNGLTTSWMTIQNEMIEEAVTESAKSVKH